MAEEEEEEEEEGHLFHSYSSKQRRRLLQRAGVVRIEQEEKRQLQELRRWREDCGCHCQGFCEPLTCTCSLAGVKCQVLHCAVCSTARLEIILPKY